MSHFKETDRCPVCGEWCRLNRLVIETAKRELERASDVRANRTTIIGNAHMILSREASVGEGEQETR